METFTIRTNDGAAVIAERVRRSDILRLRGYTEDGYQLRNSYGEPVPALIRCHRKLNGTYYANVSDAVIVAELRRTFANRPDTTEANRTVLRDGRGYRHNKDMIYRNWATRLGLHIPSATALSIAA